MGAAWIRFVYASSTWHFEGRDYLHNLLKNDLDRPIIICFWHGRLAMMPCAWQWKKHPFVMLLSKHSDGRLIGRMLSRFDIDFVQGSSRRGGAEAFVKLCALALEKKVIGITPDGPKGPAYSVAPGIVALARRTQAIIVPMSFSVKRSKRMQTWDEFMFPYPFNKGVFVAGEPIFSDALPEANKEALDVVAQGLMNATHDSDAWIKEMS